MTTQPIVQPASMLAGHLTRRQLIAGAGVGALALLTGQR